MTCRYSNPQFCCCCCCCCFLRMYFISYFVAWIKYIRGSLMLPPGTQTSSLQERARNTHNFRRCNISIIYLFFFLFILFIYSYFVYDPHYWLQFPQFVNVTCWNLGGYLINFSEEMFPWKIGCHLYSFSLTLSCIML